MNEVDCISQQLWVNVCTRLLQEMPMPIKGRIVMDTQVDRLWCIHVDSHVRLGCRQLKTRATSVLILLLQWHGSGLKPECTSGTRRDARFGLQVRLAKQRFGDFRAA